ncbi:hypothetical protein ACFFGV_12930 [Pontibacillus salicampi]|uniref:Uncharacterized protein n=1 Tax=Pontibacillus salicampi TaxID=1449801 RepID=A0ABV6LPZ1_9BACI
MITFGLVDEVKRFIVFMMSIFGILLKTGRSVSFYSKLLKL